MRFNLTIFQSIPSNPTYIQHGLIGLMKWIEKVRIGLEVCTNSFPILHNFTMADGIKIRNEKMWTFIPITYKELRGSWITSSVTQACTSKTEEDDDIDNDNKGTDQIKVRGWLKLMNKMPIWYSTVDLFLDQIFLHFRFINLCTLFSLFFFMVNDVHRI